MDEKKVELTDEELVKSLECCSSCDITRCSECPTRKDCVKNDFSGVNLSLVLDFIYRLQDENKRLSLIAGMINKGVAVEIVNMQETIDTKTAQIERLTEELKDLDWYKMWHKKFKKEIDDLTLELETYRPTKLSGNGQCKCSICGIVSWTDWFSRYKGQTLCNKCLKERYSMEVE